MTRPLELAGLTLRVRDLEQQLAFYRDLLGFSVTSQDKRGVVLSLADRAFELALVHQPKAPLRPKPSIGLYHFALLLPDRKSLAAIFRRLVEAQYSRFQGASDHIVSEALYLSDPEGNGIELYRDRPQEDWPRLDGELAMVSQALDLDTLLLDSPVSATLDPKTRFGHLHLHVQDLDQAEMFFTALGMQVTQRSYPGARFLAADGYHHHVGTNLWAHSRKAPTEATGLLEYHLQLAGNLFEEVARRFQKSASAGEFVLADPIGIPVRITHARVS